MNATLLLLLLATQAPAEATPPADAAPAAAPAEGQAPATDAATTTPPAEEKPAEAAAPAAEPAKDASVPRANSQPMGESNREALIGRIVSGVVLGVGAVLITVGLVGLASAATIQLAPVLKDEYPVNENPRRTLGTVASAIAAGGLMLGLTCILGGLFGVLVG